MPLGFARSTAACGGSLPCSFMRKLLCKTAATWTHPVLHRSCCCSLAAGRWLAGAPWATTLPPPAIHAEGLLVLSFFMLQAGGSHRGVDACIQVSAC